jgi:hypothetical protein
MKTKPFTNSSIYKAEEGDIQARFESHPRLTENGGNFLFL